MNPVRTLLILLSIFNMVALSGTAWSQSSMEQEITERVLLWVRIRDANWEFSDCAYTREELQGGVYGMEIRPTTMPGVDQAELFRVTVNPMQRLLPGEAYSYPRMCTHSSERSVELLVARLNDGGLRFVSGPVLLDGHGALSSGYLSDLELANLRLAYLDPQDLHHSKSSRFRSGPPGATYNQKMILAAKSYVEYRAYSPVLHRRVAIRLQGLGRNQFEIRTLGRKGKVIKPFRYDGE